MAGRNEGGGYVAAALWSRDIPSARRNPFRLATLRHPEARAVPR